MENKVKPYKHARVSVRKFGGKEEDYQAIHDFIDSSKAHFPDMRHRAILHSSFGIYITEMVFGTYITNSDDRKVQVRDIAEQHVLDDMGRIPTVQDYLQGMPMYNWLGGPNTIKRQISLTDPADTNADDIVDDPKNIKRNRTHMVD
jgi:hypothetical protein